MSDTTGGATRVALAGAALAVAAFVAGPVRHVLRNRGAATRLVWAVHDCPACTPARWCPQHSWEVREFARSGDVDGHYWERWPAEGDRPTPTGR